MNLKFVNCRDSNDVYFISAAPTNLIASVIPVLEKMVKKIDGNQKIVLLTYGDKQSPINIWRPIDSLHTLTIYFDFAERMTDDAEFQSELYPWGMGGPRRLREPVVRWTDNKRDEG